MKNQKTKELPPLHPTCRCVPIIRRPNMVTVDVEFIEVKDPKLLEGNLA